MVNKIKNFLLVLAFIITSVFLGLGTARAADTIKINDVIAGNGINFRTTSGGVAAYSMGSEQPGPEKGDKLALRSIYNRGYYLYILDDSKYSGNKVAVSRTIKQKALWKVRGFKIVGSYADEATKLANAAKTDGADYYVEPSIVSVENPGLLTKDGKYYFSKKIKVKLNKVKDNSYDVSFVKAPKNTVVINKSNSSFQVRVPEESINGPVKFNITVTGELSPYKYVKQYHKDSNTDDVAILYSTYKSPSRTVTATIDPNVSLSDYDDSEDGTYNVTLYIVSGKNYNVVKVKSGTKMTKPSTPIREGYDFVGWYTDDTYTTKYNFDKPVNGNFELYAKWELASYKVKYKSNGGTSVKSETVLYNQEVTKPQDPVRSGYYFAGWYKDSGFNEKYSFLTTVSKDITLYAKWTREKPNTHDVTFVPGFGVDPIIREVENGGLVTAPLVTNRESSNLAGWFTDSAKQNEFDFNTTITEDLVLYAKWLTKEGEELIETPDTASPASVITLVAGAILLFGGGYVVYNLYGKNFIKNRKKNGQS